MSVDRQSLRKLDLNLLITLDALLAERHVSRAADKLGLGQPTVSASLARLRRHFGDELLVRRGNEHELTTLGRELRLPVADAVQAVQHVFRDSLEFDPSASTRRFVIACTDFTAAVILPPLMAHVRSLAPHVTFRIENLVADASLSDPMIRLREVDGAILPHGFLSGIPFTNLHRDQWLVTEASTSRSSPPSKTDLESRPWVAAVMGDGNYHLGMRQLMEAGVAARVDVEVHSLMAVPYLLVNSDRFALVQAAFVRALGGQLGLRGWDCPVPIKGSQTAFWWHPSRGADAAHRWLRQEMSRRSQATPEPFTWMD